LQDSERLVKELRICAAAMLVDVFSKAICERVLPWCLWNSASSPFAPPGDSADFMCEGKALLTADTADAIVSTEDGLAVYRARAWADVLLGPELV